MTLNILLGFATFFFIEFVAIGIGINAYGLANFLIQDIVNHE